MAAYEWSSTHVTEPTTQSGRVDSHHHLWDLAVRDQPWTDGLPLLQRSFDFSDIRPLLFANHVDRTVVVQTVDVPGETPELLALAAREPAIGGVVGWVDLCSPAVEDQIASLRELPGGNHLVGIRHHVQDEPDERWLCRPEVQRGLRAVGAAGLVNDLVVHHDQLPVVIEAAGALDEVTFVLDHGGKPLIAKGEVSPWRELMAHTARLPNVAVKLSGLVTEADYELWTVDQLRPYADVILGAFGASRTMWGSDWPVCLLAASYERVVESASQLTASLSPVERDAFFGGTAVEWYGLAGAGD
jgi:L-fuconolactonase